MTHPLQQRRFRRISATAVRASKNVQLSQIENRLRAFQRVIHEIRTLPPIPQRVTQTANVSFKNKFYYISVTDEAIDFKLGMQLGFAKAHHQILVEEKLGVALG